jgi:hypothetical protein
LTEKKKKDIIVVCFLFTIPNNMTTTFHNIPEDIRGAENFFEEYKDAM